MSELRVREACKHGRYESHPMPDAEPTALLGLAGMAFSEKDICEGGREMVLRGPIPATQAVFPLVDECLLVYATEERVHTDGLAERMG